MIRLILGIILLTLILIGYKDFVITRKKKNFVDLFSIQLKNLDQTYGIYIDKTLSSIDINDTDLNEFTKRLVEDTFTVIKPQIRELISLICNQKSTKFRLSLDLNYFQPLLQTIHTTIPKLVKASRKKRNSVLKEEKNNLYLAFEDAIKSDINKRIIDLKVLGYFDKDL